MLVRQTRLSCATAESLAQLSIDYAKANNWDICVAVCDPDGTLLTMRRTDGVIIPAIEFAIDKAYTAATLRKSTQDFFERAEAKPSLKAGLANRDRIMLFPGGVPVVVDEQHVGGIGVSGAQDYEDVEIAEYALRHLEHFE